jgi:hypothetical protein
MTRKFALRLVLLLTVLITFSACDVNSPEFKKDPGAYIKAVIEAFASSLRKGPAMVTREYHSRLDCEGIVNNEKIQTTLAGTSSAEEAEAEGYKRCEICIGSPNEAR